MQIINHDADDIGYKITEIITPTARVIVLMDNKKDKGCELSDIEKKLIVRQLCTKNIRNHEAVIYNCATPIDLIAYFPRDMVEYIPQKQKKCYIEYFLNQALNSFTNNENTATCYDYYEHALTAIEQVRLISAYKDPPTAGTGKRSLFISREIKVGDISIKAYDNNRSNSCIFSLAIEAEGQQTIIPHSTSR